MQIKIPKNSEIIVVIFILKLLLILIHFVIFFYIKYFIKYKYFLYNFKREMK